MPAPSGPFLALAHFYETEYTKDGDLPAPIWEINLEARTLELPRLDGRGIEAEYDLVTATGEMMQAKVKVKKIKDLRDDSTLFICKGRWKNDWFHIRIQN